MDPFRSQRTIALVSALETLLNHASNKKSDFFSEYLKYGF
jgi:hypothetical protein